MAVNKVVYGGTTLVDLTSDTVTADKLLAGETAHKADGTIITGAVSFQTIYSGSTDPSSGTGSNGDIYIKVTS